MSEPRPKTLAESVNASWTHPRPCGDRCRDSRRLCEPDVLPDITTIGEFRDAEKLVTEALVIGVK
jgi:hypothetical protein